ncbi:hypothetical protein [Virgisporangium ochraceum]|uniref:Uncharacterized protein n=1 Tax=Virgisporangium ochraceum TaxID=65505 RepID=A0A8J4ECJ5_9ACTN|nr:hypothetical protein [Virgisporangium ochraceum]GIJ66957.1 hypothetical protein Voc01_018740 [Virgisporangium ochraceum]
MADRDLKLNSLSRYSKESPLLILEEHGHCEVPAGCGGVVLRWRDPRAGVPLLMRMYAEGECTVLLDGQAPPAARTVVPYGEHVLGFVVSGFDPAYLVLMFRMANDPPSRGVSRPVTPFQVVTAADGRWRYTVDDPTDGTTDGTTDGAWARPGFDDGAWAGLVHRPDRRPPDDPKRDLGSYRVDRLARDGAVGLGVPDEAGAAAAPTLWIRHAFTIGAPA